MGRKTIIIISSCVAILLLLTLGYAGWNGANPQRTCASCHEIVPSFEEWEQSAHRAVTCTDCHGTAMGNGFHSLKEKIAMLLAHLRNTDQPEAPGLDEAGVLRVMEACSGCHRDEYQSWMAGGHSATYGDIFLNEKQNSQVRPYPDCLRCHGMYYAGNIGELMEPISTTGPWHLKEPDKSDDPVIPCLVCHPIHLENEPLSHPGTWADPAATFYERGSRNQMSGLYLRSDRMHLRADLLPGPELYMDGQRVLVSSDPVQHICIQCHAPNWAHEAGTEDDRTPTGVHEGISCRACHRGHSNDPTGACFTCHPAVTSCNQDVMVMNTSYKSRSSPNNIHSMKCTDCHDPIPSNTSAHP
jgi:hypothetical protein